MMQVWQLVVMLVSIVLGFVSTAFSEQPQAIAPDGKTGTAQAVVVPDVPLVQTTQLLPLDSQGKLPGNAAKQTSQLLKNVDTLLAEGGSGLQHLVRLNLYIAQEEDIEEIGKQVGRLLKARASPA